MTSLTAYTALEIRQNAAAATTACGHSRRETSGTKASGASTNPFLIHSCGRSRRRCSTRLNARSGTSVDDVTGPYYTGYSSIDAAAVAAVRGNTVLGRASPRGGTRYQPRVDLRAAPSRQTLHPARRCRRPRAGDHPARRLETRG